MYDVIELINNFIIKTLLMKRYSRGEAAEHRVLELKSAEYRNFGDLKSQRQVFIILSQ